MHIRLDEMKWKKFSFSSCDFDTLITISFLTSTVNYRAILFQENGIFWCEEEMKNTANFAFIAECAFMCK